MNKLKCLENMGFKTSWKLISIGLFGEKEIPTQLTYNDVLEFLDNSLAKIDEQTNNAIALFCEKDDFTRFSKLLKELAENEQSDATIQKRKWRAYLLKKILDNISEDCLQGLLELMGFWMSMQELDDCPQTFPDSNQKSIQDYFTQSSYEFNVAKNQDWLNEEILTIIKEED